MNDDTTPISRPGQSVVVDVLALEDGSTRRRRDRVATEEPLEIRACGPDQAPVSVAVTMRTPGSDFELAAGFLYTEGLLRGRDQIAEIRYCTDVADAAQAYNIATLHLRSRFDTAGLQRNFYATSSCGVCGKASIDQIEVACAPLPAGPAVDAAVIHALPAALRASQRTFERTGGLHASGLFSIDGQPLVIREDVGRHNALDKLVGACLLEGALPLADRVVLVSGRASFELVQKTAMAGVPIMCAVGAPSSLAIDAARRLGLTLVGFVRDQRLNVYTHPARVELSRGARATA